MTVGVVVVAADSWSKLCSEELLLLLAAKDPLRAAGASPTAVPLAEEHSADRVRNSTPPAASVVVVVVVDAKRTLFRTFSLLLPALPYPPLALLSSNAAAPPPIDRVLIDPVRVARNAVSDPDIAGGPGGGGGIEFSEREEESTALALLCWLVGSCVVHAACGWFFSTLRRIQGFFSDYGSCSFWSNTVRSEDGWG